MVNLVIPLAGLGARFANIEIPKSLITVGDKTNIEWSLSCIDRTISCRTIFVIRPDQQINFSLADILKNMFGESCYIVFTKGFTRGATETVLAAEEYINNSTPLVIYCPDVYFEPHLNISSMVNEEGIDGRLWIFKANSLNYSYVETYKNYAVRTAEKKIISPYAAVGVYKYSKGSDFVQIAKEMINKDDTTNNEFYICPTYNYLINQGKIIATSFVEKVHIFGTPEEMNFFVNCSMRTFSNYKKSVALCSDHSGYEVKEGTKKELDKLGIKYIDFGTFNSRDCDYTGYVQESCNAIKRNDCSFGLGFCRTGQGINITANKIKRIRSALVFDPYTAEYAIRHNCANFFSVPTKYIDTPEKVGILIKAWLYNTFDGGRHQNRLQGAEDDNISS